MHKAWLLMALFAGVRLFQGTVDESNSDHLMSLRCGRDGGSGSGTAPSA
jgi:hypothetical protein